MRIANSIVLTVLFLMLLGLPTDEVEASPVIGKSHVAVLLWHDSPNDLAALRGLKRGLAAMEICQQITLLEAHGNEGQARQLLRNARKKNVDLFVALGTRSAQIAASEIKDIPIVFTAVTNPVLSGITPSWRGSGRNIAGNSNWLDRRDMLASFRQALPTLKRLCVLRSPHNSVSKAEIAEAHAALKSTPGLSLIEVEVKDPKKVGQLLKNRLDGMDAVWVPIDFPLYQSGPLAQIIAESKKRKIPVFSSTSKCAGAGALLVITVDYELLGLKASAIIRDVLRRHKKPGDVIVGRMKSSRLFLDLKAARQIGLNLPFDLILAAHRLFGAEVGR